VNSRALFTNAFESPGRGDPQHQLKEPDQLFTARMQKPVTAGPAESPWQDVLHEQVEKLLPGNGSGPAGSGFGVKIPVGDHPVFILQDILFTDDTPIEVLAEIDDSLIAVAHILAVNYPVLWTGFGHVQAMLNHGLQQFCPEDFGQGLVVEEIAGVFNPPESGFQVDCCCGHDHMDMWVIVKSP